MKRFLDNIFKTFFGNVISLLTGILVGFFIPKMMGLVGYANYKTYTLYLTYIALASLGLGDGVLLKFAGKERDELNPKIIRYYIQRYYIQILILFFLCVAGSFVLVPVESRFIAIALCFTILSSQTVSVHQNISVLTNNFGEYSKRIIIKSACTAVFVLALYAVYRFTKNEIRYEIYIIGVMTIEYFLALWYVYTYYNFNFGKSEKLSGDESYFRMLYIGFPLLLSNMAGTIFLTLDRQYVSILFPKESYAIYAFAYNMLTLVTTMTSAISHVLFPSMRKIGNMDIKVYMQKYLSTFSILVVFCMIVYFPLSVIVNWFLDKYSKSIDILRIILPGLVISSCVTVIFFNFYKLENKVKQYFSKTVLSIVFSALMNYFAWLLFHDYRAISWASIISLVFWFLLVSEYFVRTYRVHLGRVCLYSIVMFGAFYGLTYSVSNPYIGAFVYILVFVIITMLFYPTKIKEGRDLWKKLHRI